MAHTLDDDNDADDGKGMESKSQFDQTTTPSHPTMGQPLAPREDRPGNGRHGKKGANTPFRPALHGAPSSLELSGLECRHHAARHPLAAFHRAESSQVSQTLSHSWSRQ